MPPVISLLDAVILGIVEGLTEFLPVSSTGHLILVSEWLGLHRDPQVKAGVDAFGIVIQSGALLAVAGIYRTHILSLLRGIFAGDRNGRNLFFVLLTAFLPAAVVGLSAGDWIKGHLFGLWPVVAALAAGGILMIAVERYRSKRAAFDTYDAGAEKPITAMNLRAALLIGIAQCFAMWPGTSRSMVTIVAGRVLGFQPKAAAEFSFLLALPTLGAATAYDLVTAGPHLLEASGWDGLAAGLAVSCLVAWLAVRGFLAYLNSHGMAPFGWYRIALALVLAISFSLW